MISRRGLLAGIFAAGIAPAFATSGSVMKIFTPKIIKQRSHILLASTVGLTGFLADLETDHQIMLQRLSGDWHDTHPKLWVEEGPETGSDGRLYRKFSLPSTYPGGFKIAGTVVIPAGTIAVFRPFPNPSTV